KPVILEHYWLGPLGVLVTGLLKPNQDARLPNRLDMHKAEHRSNLTIFQHALLVDNKMQYNETL
uniref:hypothetical protein n=1 Tax=Tropheryma whipplei TaxID=2039 RepID=UPI001E37CC28